MDRDVATALPYLLLAQNTGWKKRKSCTLVLSQGNKEDLPQMLRAKPLSASQNAEQSHTIASLLTDTGHGIACGLSGAGVGLSLSELHAAGGRGIPK